MTFTELDAQLRTNHTFRQQCNPEYHLNDSEFLNVDIDMISSFSIDYMHAVCLGVMKRLLNIWLGKDNIFNHRVYRIRNTREMNSRIDVLSKSIPSNIFARRPRKIDHISFWKATEYRLFLLYTGHIILKDLLPTTYYNNCMCLSCSMLILINPNTNSDEIAYAQKLLCYFVNECESLYGNYFSIYNVHMITHIADDRLRYKDLDYCSSFKFENYLGMLKNLIRSGFLPLKQLINRLSERQGVAFIPKVPLVEVKVGNTYIISENKACRIVNIQNEPFCKIYKLRPLYTYPCDSTMVGIFSAIPYGTSIIHRDRLTKHAILVDCESIYDDSEIVIQSIQHVF